MGGLLAVVTRQCASLRGRGLTRAHSRIWLGARTPASRVESPYEGRRWHTNLQRNLATPGETTSGFEPVDAGNTAPTQEECNEADASLRAGCARRAWDHRTRDRDRDDRVHRGRVGLRIRRAEHRAVRVRAREGIDLRCAGEDARLDGADGRRHRARRTRPRSRRSRSTSPSPPAATRSISTRTRPPTRRSSATSDDSVTSNSVTYTTAVVTGNCGQAARSRGTARGGHYASARQRMSCANKTFVLELKPPSGSVAHHPADGARFDRADHHQSELIGETRTRTRRKKSRYRTGRRSRSIVETQQLATKLAQLESRVATLEDEGKIVKGEVKQILTEIRSAILVRDNPFDGDGGMTRSAPPALSVVQPEPQRARRRPSAPARACRARAARASTQPVAEAPEPSHEPIPLRPQQSIQPVAPPARRRSRRNSRSGAC